MASSEFRSLSDVPDALLLSCTKRIWEYTIGFVRVRLEGKTEVADLLGSGVLVRAGKSNAILTADHVLSVLPKSGRLGLILSDKEERTTIDVSGIEAFSIERGKLPELGPDIGAVLLSPPVASSLQARKSFYNLDLRKERMLSNPPR